MDNGLEIKLLQTMVTTDLYVTLCQSEVPFLYFIATTLPYLSTVRAKFSVIDIASMPSLPPLPIRSLTASCRSDVTQTSVGFSLFDILMAIEVQVYWLEFLYRDMAWNKEFSYRIICEM